MLDGGFWSLFDECPARALAKLNVTGLQHENANTCVRLRNFKANIALDVRQSVVERCLLAPSDEVAQAVLDDIVRQIVDVGIALAKDAGKKQRANSCQPKRWS